MPAAPLRLVLAPDAYKDAVSAAAACDALARGARRAAADASIARCPIADGGEGFVDAFARLPSTTTHTAHVTGPRGETLAARWVLLETPDAPPTAVLELAQAAGLERVPPAQRDPTRTTTYGVGELLRIALDTGATRLVLGVGGSATNDAGCGLAQALGVAFFDGNGTRLDTPITGGDLVRIQRIDLTPRDPRLKPGTLAVACDVTNPLHGPHGAAHIYARQKGATPAQITQLDAGLRHVEALWRGMNLWPEHTAGFGAAGGTAGGAACLLGATLAPGADLVLDAVGFDALVRGADLVLTGEGRLDGQSLSGKAVMKVALRAAKFGVPTIALVGSADAQAQRCVDAGLHGYEVLAPHLPPEDSIARTAELLADAAERVVRAWIASTSSDRFTRD